MASLFDKLEAEAFRKGLTARSKEANDWFAKNVAKLGKIGPGKILSDDKLRKQAGASPGDMVMYTYNPKHKETLPYYDTFPLVLPLQGFSGGFVGMNFHYLSPMIRFRVLQQLQGFATNQKFDSTTKLDVSYARVGGIARIKPTIKHYLTEKVTSNIMKVNAAEWNIAIFLKTASFKKASASKVWADSRSQY